jgi:hypothetical protein
MKCTLSALPFSSPKSTYAMPRLRLEALWSDA